MSAIPILISKKSKKVFVFQTQKGKTIKTRNVGNRSTKEFIEFIENKFNVKLITIRGGIR